MILEAITAIKIANEAIGQIKQFASHIKSVGELGPHLTKLADAKDILEKKAAQGDMNCFFELENIRLREAEIKQMFIYQGRPGLWEDYQKFVANRKQIKESERKRLEADKVRKAKQMKEILKYTGAFLISLPIIGGAIAIMLYIIGLKD